MPSRRSLQQGHMLQHKLQLHFSLGPALVLDLHGESFVEVVLLRVRPRPAAKILQLSKLAPHNAMYTLATNPMPPLNVLTHGLRNVATIHIPRPSAVKQSL